MTPYGIVYRDNLYALEKSVKIWQKKFGVFNIPTFLKIGGISAVILLAINLLLGYLSDQGIISYILTFLFMIIFVFVLIYMTINNTYVKQMALANTQKEDKQILLYDDRLEFGTGYTRATYYYSDIVLCSEEADVITIITDTAAMPLSIQKSSVSKGTYDEFSFILRKYMGGKYQYMGGKG